MQTDKDHFHNRSIIFNMGMPNIRNNPSTLLITIDSSKRVVYLRTINRQRKRVAPRYKRACCENLLVPKDMPVCISRPYTNRTVCHLFMVIDFLEIQPVHPEGGQSWVFIGRTDAEVETPVLWPPHAKS